MHYVRLKDSRGIWPHRGFSNRRGMICRSDTAVLKVEEAHNPSTLNRASIGTQVASSSIEGFRLCVFNFA